MDDILAGLNPQQKSAVSCPLDVLQVLAPPGSGKTKTLTGRVAYHIAHEGIHPWNIIVCTFTIKAAREMKERIRSFVGEQLESKLVLGTFHSIARRYLSTYGGYIGIPKHFGIADSNDSLSIIKRIVKKGKYSLEPAKARSRISTRKSGVVRPKSATTAARLDVEQQEFETIFAAYEQELKDAKLLDYDDLLLRCVELLTKHPECVSNIEAVLIDEFQDTNHVQYELMNLFAQHRRPHKDARTPKITIVGDPDQSIYSFRSAEIQNLKRMHGRYPDTQVIHLQENYRSSGSILRFATEVIEQDEARPQKSLQATHSVGQSPVLRTLVNASIEASWVVSEIRRSHHLNAGLLTFSDYAILLRSASLSRLIETELGRAGIPYRMIGGAKFFDRVEVRILLDYLRVISQPDHNDALLRILNVPSRKLGETSVQSLLRERDARSKTLWYVIKATAQGNLRPVDRISQQAMTGLETFTDVILTARHKLSQPDTTIGSLLAFVTQKLKYENFLRDTFKEEYDDRAVNVDEFVTLAQNGKVFAEQEAELIEIEGIMQQQSDTSGPAEALAQFLSKIALATDADKQDADNASNDKVVISTIHAAKGLEWPVVFIPAAYQGSIPHSRAENIDEERRLLYVGMTRAKALLYLSWPKMSSKTEHTVLSPFLTTPTISRYYECKGPTFGWQVSQELARILGRDAPTNEAIHARYLSLGKGLASGIWPEDDRHKEEMDQESEYGSLFKNTYSAEELDGNYGGPRKKRRHGGDAYLPQDEATNSAHVGGFVSARHQMHEITAQSTRVGNQKRAKPANSLAVKQSSARPPKKATPTTTSQRDISTFFSAKVQTTSAQTAVLPSSHNDHIQAISKATVPKVKPPSTSSQVKNSSLALPGASRTAYTQPSLHKPKVLLDQIEQSRPTHVLLSSSPTKADDYENHEGDAAHGLHNNSGGKENSLVATEIIRSQSVQGKAHTMHTTSMQRLTNLQGHPGARKTLGGRPQPGGYVNTKYRPPTMR